MNNTLPKHMSLADKPRLLAVILILILVVFIMLVVLEAFKNDIFIDMLHSLGWRSDSDKRNSCVSNLRHIESAKDQYALEYGGTNGTLYTWYQLSFYVKDFSNKAICQSSSGRMTNIPNDCYSIETLGKHPQCRITKPEDGHALTNR